MELKITVVTVCYNAVETIERTMLSVLGQTYPNIEYIIIDGGSTDGTVDIIKKYAERLAYWVSEPDKGIFDAMNKGIANATGDYLNFMNAGDRYFSDDALQSLLTKRKTNSDFIAGIAIPTITSKIPVIWEPVRSKFTISEVINGGACNHQSCIVRRDVFKDGNYPLDYGIIADDLFFLERVAFGNCSYEAVYSPVAIYDTTGISNRSDLKVLREELRSNFLKSHLTPNLELQAKTMPKRFGIPVNRIRKLQRWCLRISFYLQFMRQ